MRARTRQVIIGTLIALIVAVAAYGIFLYAVQPADPTCFDDILNHGEEGPDCGGPCGVTCEEKYPAPIVFKTEKIIASKENTYDAVLALENKNSFMGALNVEYELTLRDSQGNAISRKRAVTYAWPNERRLIVESALVAPTLASIDVAVIGFQWEKFEQGTRSPSFPVAIEYFGPLSEGQIGFFEVNGTITNEMLRSYDSLDVFVVVRNEQNEIISANATRLNNLEAQEKRFFRVIWFNPFSGTARSVETYISTDPARLNR